MRLHNLSGPLVAGALLVLGGCGEEMIDAPVDQAVDYEIIAKNDISIDVDTGRREARSIWIYAEDAASQDQKIHTALKSAKDVLETDGAAFVESHLLVAPNESLVGTSKYTAKGRYAPDGKDETIYQEALEFGTWEARYSDVELTEQDIRIIELWFENRDRFAEPAAYGTTQVNEQAMREFIGDELGLPADEVEMKRWQTYKIQRD